MGAATKQVRDFTWAQIRRIITMKNEGERKAALANLRSGAGCAPGEKPQLWGEFLLDMPEEMYSPSGEPSCAEWAVYTALTLFALHQQGKEPDSACMNVEGQSLGHAAARLVRDEEDRPRVWRRFGAVASAEDMRELAVYLRALVQLLRAEDIGLDYPGLAADLFDYQHDSRRDRVRLRWGQDFYRRIERNDPENERTQEENENE
ncbi:MAG: type I-E CRISPR-associated protein Cse2/CasB [Clostridia bacterium]|nr:type I-E CRISPR-associated protein Cse2/CasB [Clostridia bacterium]